MRSRLGWWLCRIVPVVVILLPLGPAWGLVSLDDAELEGVSGSGIAIVLEDMDVSMGPQSYIQSIGATPESGTTLQRGDLYWFGLTLSGDSGNGQQWSSAAGVGGYGCDTSSAVAGNLACAIGGTNNTPSRIGNLAAFDNPYLIRVFSYQAPDANNHASVSNTVMELDAPTCVGAISAGVPTAGCAGRPEDAFRWAFWGAVQVTASSSGVTASTSSTLKDQAIIEGVPASYYYPSITAGYAGSSAQPNMYRGDVFQVFPTIPVTGTASTLGIVDTLSLSGNFRFGVGQTGAADADLASIGTVPDFDNAEGLYFRNVQSYIPLGRLHYQALTFDSDGAGNLIIELTALPDQPNDYMDFYGLESSELSSSSCTGADTSQCGYRTAHDAQCTTVGGVDCGFGNWTNVPVNYFQTHGYVQWGIADAGSAGSTVLSTYNLPGCSTYAGSAPWACTSASANLLGSRPYEMVYYTTGSGGFTPGPCTSYACYTSTQDGIYFSAGNTGQTFTAAATNSDPSCTSTSICAGYKTTTQSGCGLGGGSGNGCNTYYSDAGLNTVNLGTANIQGLLIQHLKVTLLGAAKP